MAVTDLEQVADTHRAGDIDRRGRGVLPWVNCVGPPVVKATHIATRSQSSLIGPLKYH